MALNIKLQHNHIFEGKIRKFEEQLINISLEIGKRRGQNPIITRILTYLLIHGQLTQKQLKELTNCSIGSISTHLAAMISIGLIEKKLISGTHTNKYSLKIDLGQSISSVLKISLDYINQTRAFLKVKRSELNEMFQKKKNKLGPIIERFEELEFVIEIYIKLFDLVFKSDKGIYEIELKETKELDYLQEFDPDIKEIENDIIDFFTYTPMFFGKYEIFSKTFAYFITRKTLNQKKLRKLSGLSAGKVSQEINTLLELGIIEIVDTSQTGQITYQMKSVILAFLKVSFNVLSEYMKWKKTIESLYSELEEQKEDLKNLHGYYEVLKVVKIFLEIMPIYEKMYNAVLMVRKKLNIS